MIAIISYDFFENCIAFDLVVGETVVFDDSIVDQENVLAMSQHIVVLRYHDNRFVEFQQFGGYVGKYIRDLGVAVQTTEWIFEDYCVIAA